jgi:hypothetical protein
LSTTEPPTLAPNEALNWPTGGGKGVDETASDAATNHINGPLEKQQSTTVEGDERMVCMDW